jgi:hypothetical protein
MGTVSSLYKGHRYPVEIISYCVWLYHRFPPSFRGVEEIMLTRSVVVSYETIRAWCAKFVQTYANGLRRRWLQKVGDRVLAWTMRRLRSDPRTAAYVGHDIARLVARLKLRGRPVRSTPVGCTSAAATVGSTGG